MTAGRCPCGFSCLATRLALVFASHSLAPLSIFDTADTRLDQLDGTPAFELSE